MALAFSPDRSRIAWLRWSDYGTDEEPRMGTKIHLLDARGRLLRTYDYFWEAWMGGSDFSPDGRHLAVVVPSRDIHILDAATGALQRVLKCSHTTGGVCYSPCGRVLLVGDYEGPGQIISLATGGTDAFLFEYPGHHVVAAVSSLLFATAKRMKGQTPGELVLWNGPGRPRFLATLTDALGEFRFSPNGRLLAVSLPGEIQLWDVAKAHLVRALKHHKADGQPSLGRSLDFSLDSQLLAVEGDDFIRIWSIGDGRCYREFPTSGPLMVAFRPDGRSILGGNSSWGRITCYDLDPWWVRLQRRFRAPTPHSIKRAPPINKR